MGDSSMDEASVMLPALWWPLLASLSTGEDEVIEELEEIGEISWMSIGDVPTMSCALFRSMLLVERRATGDEMCARSTGFPPR